MKKLARHLWRLLRSPVTRIFLLLVLQYGPVMSCPPLCSCTQNSNGTVVICSEKNLNTLPDGIPLDTVILDLSSNNMVDLSTPTGSNTVFPKVTKLLLNVNKITTLFSRFFHLFPNVEVVNLDSNSIEDIQDSAFIGLNKLKIIHLQNNQLVTLKSFIFKGLVLEELDLDSNKINTIAGSTFENSSIVTLKLDHNDLSTLSNVVLNPLGKSLQNLYLSFNKRPLQLDTQTFEGFSLHDLKLCYNQMTNCSFLSSVNTSKLYLSGNSFAVASLQQYPNLHQVEELVLSNSNIQALASGYFKNFPNMLSLDLRNNQISSFPTGLFAKNSKLTHLQLDHNKLWKFPLEIGQSCPHLKQLGLASNKITIITESHFRGLQLKELDLSYNLIQVFKDNLEPVFDSIPVLALNGNPFHCNCEMRWFREWLDKTIYHTGADKCHSPMKASIFDLTAKEFVCSPPVLVYTTPDKNVTEGNDVLLSCTAEGDPAPEISFTDPGAERISISPQKNRTNTKTYAMWQVNSIPYNKAGYYICKASNVIGTVVGSICVSVMSPQTDEGMRACKRTTTMPSTTTTTVTTNPPTSQLKTSTFYESTTTTAEQKKSPPNILQSTSSSFELHTPTENAMEDSGVSPAHRLAFILCLALGASALLLILLVVLIWKVKRQRAVGRYAVAQQTDCLQYHPMNKTIIPTDKVPNGAVML